MKAGALSFVPHESSEWEKKNAAEVSRLFWTEPGLSLK